MKRFAMIVVFLLAFGFVAKVGAQSVLPLSAQNKVIATDSMGRVKATEMITSGGSCMAEIIYSFGPLPEVHLVVFQKNGGMADIGHWLLLKETEQSLTDEKLMAYFDQIIRKRCLPMITPGYASL